MNVGFAVMLSGVVCLSALALIGSFMDSVTDKKWMDWWPIVGAVFSMAILVLVFVSILGGVFGAITAIWSYV